MKHFTKQNHWSLADRFAMGAAVNRWVALLTVLLLMLLAPVRISAMTAASDPFLECVDLDDGITMSYDNSSSDYPWQVIDFNAEGMNYLESGYVPADAKGFMSGNYGKRYSNSYLKMQFESEKPFVLAFDYAVATSYSYFYIYVDGTLQKNASFSDKMQTPFKIVLDKGLHNVVIQFSNTTTVQLYSADRAFVYNMKASASLPEAVAEYDSADGILTYKALSSSFSDKYVYPVFDGMNGLKDIPFCYAVKHVVIDESFKTFAPTTLASFWYGFTSLETVQGLEHLNMSNVTSLASMFEKCNVLKSIDLSILDTRNVTSMSDMFYGVKNLQSIKFGGLFNTSNVTSMNSMFYDCRQLEELDLTGFNTRNVTSMSCMFEDNYALKKIYVSDLFSTDKVETRSSRNMFTDCNNLPNFNSGEIDKTHANYKEGEGYFTYSPTARIVYNSGTKVLSCAVPDAPATLGENEKVVAVLLDPAKYAYWFNGSDNDKFSWTDDAKQATSAVIDKSFKGYAMPSCRSLFDGFGALASIDGLEYLNTENVSDMSNMFYGCKALTKLDLVTLDISKVTNTSGMFRDCEKLATVYVSDLFLTDNIEQHDDMFTGATSIVGAVKYNAGKTDKAMANYKNGYFKSYYKLGGELVELCGSMEGGKFNIQYNDDIDLVAYAPFTIKGPVYFRNMNGVTWATLCLPFETTIKPEAFRAFTLLSIKDDVVELKELYGTLSAGTPAIIKLTGNSSGIQYAYFPINGIKFVPRPLTVATADGKCQLVGLFAKKVFDRDTDDNCYIVKGNKLMNPAKILDGTSTTSVGSKAFRAYLVDNSSTSAGAKSLGFGDEGDGEATGLDQLLDQLNDSTATYYDLQGHRLDGPQKGVNIVKRGGKTMKVVIR